jgi:opacity protein-like surface antigen
MLSFAGRGEAQDSLPGDDMNDRLDALRAELLDITPGYYVSPLLSASALAGTVEQNGASLDFDGYLARGGVALGYQTDPLRVELAASVGRSHIEVSHDGQTDDLAMALYDLTLSVYYDLPVDLGAYVSDSWVVIPYVGAGLGVAYVDPDGAEGDSTVVTQGAAGLGARLSPRWILDAGYRYYYLPRFESEGTDNEIAAHAAELKLRYRF